MTPEQQRHANARYRNQEPSDIHKEAFMQVLERGTLDLGTVDRMVDQLYDPFPDGKKDTPVDPFESLIRDEGNGLASAVVRRQRGISLHISEKLYYQQPIGVLLRPIDDDVRKAGEALITDVCPRSADVEDHVMPAKHYKLTVEPTPVWLVKWMGEDGYETLDD